MNAEYIAYLLIESRQNNPREAFEFSALEKGFDFFDRESMNNCFFGLFLS
jgi:hypothetical protein